MAIRFAGDFFGVPLTSATSEESSTLLQYFPELKSIKKPSTTSKETGAESLGGSKAVSPFVGFKTFETTAKEPKAAPVFAGFKTFEQPAKTKPSN